MYSAWGRCRGLNEKGSSQFSHVFDSPLGGAILGGSRTFRRWELARESTERKRGAHYWWALRFITPTSCPHLYFLYMDEHVTIQLPISLTVAMTSPP